MLLLALLLHTAPESYIMVGSAQNFGQLNQAIKEEAIHYGQLPDPQKAEFKVLTRESKQGMRINETGSLSAVNGHNYWPASQLNRFDQR